MKKFTLLFLAVIYIFCCTFALTACNNTNSPNNSNNQGQVSSQQEGSTSGTPSSETPNSSTQGTNQHIHNYDKWYSDDNFHWKVCSGEGLCDARIAEKAPHLIDTQYNICSVCKKEVSILDDTPSSDISNSSTSDSSTPDIDTPSTEEHIHIYDKWYADENAHWKECSAEGTCDAKIAEEGPHIIDTQENICSVCKKKLISIVAENNILIIDGDGKQATNMEALLDEMSYTVDVVSPANVPKLATDLVNYKEVILMNVNVNDLPKGYDKELDTYVSKYGGGLFTTGGDRTYYYGGMNGTKFDSMLPVNIIPEDNSVNGIMFVIDSSGSMYYNFNNSGSSESDCFYDESSAGFQNTPMYYIKQGLREAAVSIFAKKDYLGVMHFGKKDKVTGETYKIDLPLTKASQRGTFLNAINGIKSIKGTNWSIPLQAAADHLKGTTHKIDKKQIVFITDGSRNNLGNDASTDFAKMTKDFEDNYGISTSVIAVNSAGSGAAVDIMKSMTTAVDEQGKKRFYNCTSTEQLAMAIQDECKAASTDTMNQGGNYEVEITASAKNHPVFNGIISDDQTFPQKGIMPNIPQYNGVTVKADKDVEALLTADNVKYDSHDALYAQWSYGKGRVGSFASDLGSWAKEYYTDPEAKLFLKNVIKEILFKKTA